MHWSGLLTKQEISEMTAAFTTSLVEQKIKYYCGLIEGTQKAMGLTQRTIDVKEVVPIAVYSFFKNDMQYDPIKNDAGQPAGMTYLASISW